MSEPAICPSCRGTLESLPTRPHIQEHFYCREEKLIFAAGADGLAPCEDPEGHVLFFPARVGRP